MTPFPQTHNDISQNGNKYHNISMMWVYDRKQNMISIKNALVKHQSQIKTACITLSFFFLNQPFLGWTKQNIVE